MSNMPKTRELLKTLQDLFGVQKASKLLNISYNTYLRYVDGAEIRKAQARNIVSNADMLLSELSDLLTDSQQEYFVEYGDIKRW